MKTNNIEIIKLIFNDIHHLSEQKDVTFSIQSVLNSLVYTVCHLEGEEEYNFFVECFKKEKQCIIESSIFFGPLIHNPIFGHLQLIYIKLEYLKIRGYEKIFDSNSFFTKAGSLINFYNTEFNNLLKTPESKELPKTKQACDITPDYTWSPSDLFSPWLFVD